MAEATRRAVVYHIMEAGRRPVSAASQLVRRGGRVAVELDPSIVGTSGVFVEIDPRKLRPLDEEGVIFGYPELVDRRQQRARRRVHQATPPRGPGRRVSDGEKRSRA